ncbi:MAG: 30S ribosomal protein S12 methylthiotransferase RimO, partial [Chloroflexi bacterium]|nr:30S ribosomal protein S12 methylthiotransferase RimO [Chloroflexota bacterium]
MPRKKTYHLVTMGCAKNEVDSDSMGQIMDDGGYRRIDDPARAQVLILNTCGFIESARQQTYEELKKMADAKRPGQLLIAAGCLTQRFGAEVVRDVPGVDGILGARRWMDILDLVQRLRQGGNPAPLYHLPPDARKVGTDERGALRAAQSGTSAYLKIADGCRRPCAFCSIPLIKGSTVSRPLATIVHEARQLRDRGVR